MKESPKRLLRIGGVQRCCVATLNETPDDQLKEEEEQLLHCKYCHRDSLIFHDGAWEWNRPADLDEKLKGRP